jgi:hypothetical protein
MIAAMRSYPPSLNRSGDMYIQGQPMRIYVDSAIHRWRGKLWCHLFSPDIEALHAFAGNIGMKRAWFQDPLSNSKVSWPHYDITAQRREIAIQRGAIAVGKHQTVAMSRVAINRYFGLDGTPQAVDPLALHRRLNSPVIERVERWLAHELSFLV